MNLKNLLKENRDFVIMLLFAAIVLSVIYFPKNKEANVQYFGEKKDD